jgi:Ca-activated chloride channel homolog
MRRRLGAAALLVGSAVVFSALFSASLGADETTPPRLKSGVEVVALTVTVQNHDGSFPGDLAVDDFAVFENGVRQTISFFDHGTVPVDLALLVDSSASMSQVLPTVKHAASTLIGSLTPTDRASVMTFGGVMRQTTSFTNNHAALLDAVRDMSAGGATPLFDALYVALRSFGGSKPSGEMKRRAIVVFTDGDDTASLTTYDSVLQAARQAGIAVYTVMLKSVNQTMSARTTQNDFQMRRLAEETGARALVALEESNIDPLYKSIAAELAHQYSLGYVPAGVGEKNQYARIAVSVRGRNLTVRTRSGYMARN